MDIIILIFQIQESSSENKVFKDFPPDINCRFIIFCGFVILFGNGIKEPNLKILGKVWCHWQCRKTAFLWLTLKWESWELTHLTLAQIYFIRYVKMSVNLSLVIEKASQIISKSDRSGREKLQVPHIKREQAFLKPKRKTGWMLGKEDLLFGIDLSMMRSMLLWKKIDEERWWRSWTANSW